MKTPNDIISMIERAYNRPQNRYLKINPPKRRNRKHFIRPWVKRAVRAVIKWLTGPLQRRRDEEASNRYLTSYLTGLNDDRLCPRGTGTVQCRPVSSRLSPCPTRKAHKPEKLQ